MEQQSNHHIGVAKRVPWYSWVEWDKVYSLLFSPHIEEKQLGVKWVNMWLSRGRVPVAIEATSALVELLYLLPSLPEHSHLSEWNIRLMFSMVICRLVNGITDVSQTKLFAKSISNIAKEIRLPQSLVDIRHSSTHKQLPTLHLLEQEAAKAEKWLYENYWYPQHEIRQQSQQHVAQALSTYYSQALDEYLRASTSKQPTSYFTSTKTTKKLIKTLTPIFTTCSLKDTSMIDEILIPFLFSEESGFYPSASIVSSSTSRISGWIADVHGLVDQILTYPKSIHLQSFKARVEVGVLINKFVPPTPLISIWSTAINEFAERWFPFFTVTCIDQLYDKIVELTSSLSSSSMSLGDQTRHYKYHQSLILCAWINFFLTSFSTSQQFISKRGGGKAEYEGEEGKEQRSSNFDWEGMLEKCLSTPNHISLVTYQIVLYHYCSFLQNTQKDNSNDDNNNDTSYYLNNLHRCFTSALLFTTSDHITNSHNHHHHHSSSSSTSLEEIEKFLENITQHRNDDDVLMNDNVGRDDNNNGDQNDEFQSQHEERRCEWKLVDSGIMRHAPIGHIHPSFDFLFPTNDAKKKKHAQNIQSSIVDEVGDEGDGYVTDDSEDDDERNSNDTNQELTKRDAYSPVQKKIKLG